MIHLSNRSFKRLSIGYFVALALLMWLPLGGVSLNNYVFGLRADHLLHASVYLPCALAWSWLFPSRRWLWWLLSVLTGIVFELVQYWLPYRGFDVSDLAANFIGVTFGWLLLWWHRHPSHNDLP